MILWPVHNCTTGQNQFDFHKKMAIIQDLRHLVTLGMFIIDEFSFMDENGRVTGQIRHPQESRLLVYVYMDRIHNVTI